MFGAFENRMLNEVGDALFGSLLMARAHTNENPSVGDDGGGRAKDYADAVGKSVVVVHRIVGAYPRVRPIKGLLA